MNAIQPMSNISATILPTHYKQLVKLAKERGLVTKKGRPIVSAAVREVLAEVLGSDQGEETEVVNDD